MKCFSSRQPWASLLALGIKPVENKLKPTTYRGPILIHASLSKDIVQAEKWIGKNIPGPDPLLHLNLVVGAIIGQGEIVDYVQNHPSPWAEPGKWHWVLADAKLFDKPIHYPGRLGLFEAPDPTPEGLFKPHDGITRRVDVRKEVPDLMITRPGKWGNPWKLIKRKDDKYPWGLMNITNKKTSIYSSKEYALITSLNLYEAYINNNPNFLAALPELKGKRLGCFCKANEPCHGDILVKLVNEQC